MITADHVKAVYAMLREFPPFSRWGLPESDEVEFDALDDDGTTLAEFCILADGDAEVLCISANPILHSHISQLIKSVAHEMCHMRQHMTGRLPDNPQKHHNAAFRRAAYAVAKELGFDVLEV